LFIDVCLLVVCSKVKNQKLNMLRCIQLSDNLITLFDIVETDMDEQTKLAKAQADLKRWLTRLKRAATMVDKLQSKIVRLNRKIGAAQFSGIKSAGLGSPGRSETKMAAPAVAQAPPPCTEVIPGDADLAPPSDLSIPAQFLRGKDKDDAARAEITAQLEAKKTVKAKASKAKSIAKAKGDLRKMPLTGKAALAYIAQK
jgi:hypothetical protein